MLDLVIDAKASRSGSSDDATTSSKSTGERDARRERPGDERPRDRYGGGRGGLQGSSLPPQFRSLNGERFNAKTAE